MRVKHWVLDDRYGAGRAAVRISTALRTKVDSKVFVLIAMTIVLVKGLT